MLRGARRLFNQLPFKVYTVLLTFPGSVVNTITHNHGVPGRTAPTIITGIFVPVLPNEICKLTVSTLAGSFYSIGGLCDAESAMYNEGISIFGRGIDGLLMYRVEEAPGFEIGQTVAKFLFL